MGWLVAFVVAGLGLGAFLRRRRKRRRVDEDAAPADELKAKLAESRAGAAEVDGEPEEAEATIESDLEARRQGVHERARGAIDELS